MLRKNRKFTKGAFVDARWVMLNEPGTPWDRQHGLRSENRLAELLDLGVLVPVADHPDPRVGYLVAHVKLPEQAV